MAPPHAIKMSSLPRNRCAAWTSSGANKQEEYMHDLKRGIWLPTESSLSSYEEKSTQDLKIKKKERLFLFTRTRVSDFVMDVKPLKETSIKHNRINVPDDHPRANRVQASK